MADTESKRRTAQASRSLEREMSLSDVPMVIREDLGVAATNIASWQNQNIPGAIQRMRDPNGEVRVLEILNGVLAHRNREIATVAAKGEI